MEGSAIPAPRKHDTAQARSNWENVKTLFSAALALPKSEREQFLDARCGDDTALRREVESLLESSDETDDDFLEQPVASVQSMVEADPFESRQSHLTGTVLGSYRIEREIGRGGMGEVYLASRADSEFDKRVAVKLIRNGSENAVAVRRFRLERQILARLESPYIARLIDGGTTTQGLPYFVMEYVEGEAIHHYCETHSLTIRDRLNLFLKVCSAVQYAHERNIVHRDLKPGNILVRADGNPTLLDFGIAKILSSEGLGHEADATHHAFRMLTPAYASPEQLRGEVATTKSDLFSLGVILYELLCGQRPDEAHIYQNQTDSSTTTHGSHLSASLRAIVLRAIQINPAGRYTDVEAFAADLRRYLGGTLPLARTPHEFEHDHTAKLSLAILPFRVLGNQNMDKAFLAHGVTETLITKLSRLERLSLTPPSAVLKYADGADAVRAARELRVRYVLEGSIQFLGENVRVSVQLVLAESGAATWATQIETTEAQLLKMEDSIAEQVAFAVVPYLTGDERAEISKSGTTNGAAHSAYLRGRWYWYTSAGDQEKLVKSLVCFMEAIAIDPNFARAHAGVADYYLRLGLWGGVPPSESFAAAIQSARTAVALDPVLGEAHASLAFATWAYERDEAAAEKHFNLATLRSPNYASAHHWFGLLNSARNHPELAIANLERAQRVDPNSPMIAAALGFVHYNARKFNRALQLLSEAVRELPKSGIIHEMLSWCYLQLGTYPEALASARKAVQLTNRSSGSLSALAHAEASNGNTAEAFKLYGEIEELSKTRHVSSYDRATAALATGQMQKALAHLEQARADRDWWTSWLGVDPRWDALRKEARFRKLLPQAADGRKTGMLKPAYALVALGVVIGGAGAWWVNTHRSIPFEHYKLSKLTSNGTAESAAISPNAENVVYVAAEAGGVGIWRRELKSGKVTKLVSKVSEKISDLGFTNNGARVEYVTYPLKNPLNRALYTISLSGGTAERVRGNYAGPVSMSADGRYAALFESNISEGIDQLFIHDIERGERRELTGYRYPQRFAWTCRPAWSPNGKLIAYAAEQNDKDGFLVQINVIDVRTGARQVVGSPRWQWVQSLEWLGGDSGLMVVGQELESSFQQMWYVPYPTATNRIRRLGNDLDDYFGASVAGSGKAIVSVQSQTLSNVYVARQASFLRPQQLTAGSGRYFDLCWMPDGRILYASDATGSADLWVMDGDGGGQRAVVSGAGRNYAPVASPDGKSLAFHSNRSGNWQVWRADLDGTHVKRVSPEGGDANWPQFSTDGRSVLFHRTGAKGTFNLWQASAAGDSAKQITAALTMHPAVARANGNIAAWYSERADDPKWKLGVFGPAGGEPLRVFNSTPGARPDSPIRWTPKGDAIAFLNYSGPVSNIWLQPADGRPAHAVTSFDSGEIYSFDWAPNGALVYSRGMTTADVVLLRDLRDAEVRK